MLNLTSIRDRITRSITQPRFCEVHFSDLATGEPLPWTVRKLSDWHPWEVVPSPCPALFGFEKLVGMRDFLRTLNGTAMAPNGVVVTLVGRTV